jgi:arylsulfatase A-like enzyme
MPAMKRLLRYAAMSFLLLSRGFAQENAVMADPQMTPEEAATAQAAMQDDAAAQAQPQAKAGVTSTPAPATMEARHGEHVVLVVWDGMRPDFVTGQYAPSLYKLSQEGVFFKNNHSIPITSTEVNGTALATGVYPNRSHIIANKEYRPETDPLAPIATESEQAIHKGDENGKYIAVTTLEEVLQNAGYPTAIAGTKAVALLPDRSLNRTSEAAKKSVVLYAGKSNPASAIDEATQALGAPFPKEVTFPNTDEDAWTTRALTEFLWKEGVPKFSLLWMSDPDFSQHSTAPGAPIALAAIKSVDENLAKVLAALDEKGARETTDIIVVSDHGFSTIEKNNDVVGALTKAGFFAASKFKEPPKPGDILVVGVGGSVLFYVTGHEAAVTQKLVDFLQNSDFAGVIFTRDRMNGTFTLDQVRLNSPESPDVMVAMQWNDLTNKYGVPGGMSGDNSRKAGQGMHATLSRFDIHNTLVAAGPDFKQGATDDLPTANVDVVPTILWILGVQPTDKLDGRVLWESLASAPQEKLQATQNVLTQERNEQGIRWKQYLKFTQLGLHIYLDEGNGGKQ